MSLKYQDETFGEIFSQLTEDNFLLFAIKNYINPVCSNISEFYDDINKIRYIKKQVSRYYLNNDINERLFLNNIITFFNVFEIEAAKIMLLHKIEFNHWSAIKTPMVFLGYMKKEEIDYIPIDPIIDEKLHLL
jgi:hypothetical protein